MTSIRRRTLTLITGLLLAGLLVLSVFNLHDSNHGLSLSAIVRKCCLKTHSGCAKTNILLTKANN